MTMMARNTEGALEHGSQGANGAAHLRDVSGDPSVSGEVMVHGVLEEVSWRTRTAVLYTEDDTAVTVRFAELYSGTMRVVANFEVNVYGTAAYDSQGELSHVDLTGVEVSKNVGPDEEMSTDQFMKMLRGEDYMGSVP